jgi:hypothetical protein
MGSDLEGQAAAWYYRRHLRWVEAIPEQNKLGPCIRQGAHYDMG